jgi:hypothetical protein
MPQVVNQKRVSSQPLWFAGICDEVLLKVVLWESAYWLGEVHSTRQWLNPKTAQIEDKPTRCAHQVPLRLQEIEHLVRIVETLRPGTKLVEELKEVQKIWKYGKPVQGYVYHYGYWSRVNLPKGIHRVVTLAFYPEHVTELLDILKEAKTGQKKASIDAAITKKKEEGKDLFEE